MIELNEPVVEAGRTDSLSFPSPEIEVFEKRDVCDEIRGPGSLRGCNVLSGEITRNITLSSIISN